LIGEAWETYLAEVIPKGASQTQIEETQKGFYAGACVVMGIFGTMSETRASPGEIEAQLEATENELRHFARMVGIPKG
jgi:hypothetical protein